MKRIAHNRYTGASISLGLLLSLFSQTSIATEGNNSQTVNPTVISDYASILVAANCSFHQPSSYVPNYFRQIKNTNQSIRPQPHNNCGGVGTIRANSKVKIHSEHGSWLFVENRSGKGWGWIPKSAIAGSSPQQPASSSNGCAFLQPKRYVPNYFKTTNSNYNLRPTPGQRCTPVGLLKAGSKVKVHSESGDWRFVENRSGRGWGWVHKNAFTIKHRSVRMPIITDATKTRILNSIGEGLNSTGRKQ